MADENKLGLEEATAVAATKATDVFCAVLLKPLVAA